MRREAESDADRSDLDRVLADYLRRVNRGEKVDRSDFIAAHPELAEELRRYFSRAAALDDEAKTTTADFARQSTPRSELEVRCPNCHAPMEIAVDTLLTDLTCSACGSHFSLVDQSQATRLAPSLTKLGRFELVERIGVGGFGSVWKARDKELDRTVAVKIPRAGRMTPEDQEKFFREARAAAQLRHPNIVSVHEVGRDGESVFIVSDLVRGITLGDWLTGQQLTSREAVELCAKIADALHHAHEQGVVHRDLKPANIMIDSGGEPHLMDFGLARREVGEVTVTMDGHVLGTPAYMSPEQAEGKGHSADRRSDVYSLGVILFQLLSGEPPFRGNARMLVHQVINDEPPSPRKFNPNIPKDLETITLKCLEKDPGKRFESAAKLGEDLRRWLSGEPIRARRVSRVERAFRTVLRHKTVSALAVAVAFSCVAGTIVSTYFAIDARRQANELLKLTKQQQRLLYLHEVRQFTQQWATLRTGEVKDFIKQELLREHPTEGKGFEFRYLVNSLCPEPIEAGLDSPFSAAAVSADHALIAAASASGHFAVFPRHAGAPRFSSFHERGVHTLVFSNDSRRLATATDSSIVVWNLESQSRQCEFAVPETGLAAFGFAADGEQIIVVTRAGQIATRDASTGNVVRLDESNLSAKASVVSPDGSLVALEVDSTFVIWDVGQRRVLRTIHWPNRAETYSFELSADSQRLVASFGVGIGAIIWNVETGEIEHHVDLRPESHTSASVASNEPRLAGVRLHKNNRLVAHGAGQITIWNLADEQRELLLSRESALEDPRYKRCVGVSSDGQLFVSAVNTHVYVHDIQALLDRHVLESATNDRLVDFAWHPNNKTLIVVSEQGMVYAWDKNTGKKSKFQIPLSGVNSFTSVVLSCDGRVLAARSVHDAGSAIQLLNLKEKQVVGSIATNATRWEPITFSPVDPHVLATIEEDGVLSLWDVRQQTQLAVTKAPVRNPRSMCFTPDGRMVLVASTGGAAAWKPNIDSLHAEQELIDVAGTAIGAVAASPGGDLVVLGGWSGKVDILDSQLRHIKYLLGMVSHPWGLHFCDNGSSVIGHSLNNGDANDGMIFLWDVDTALLKAIYELPNVTIARTALAADDSCLAVLDEKHHKVLLYYAPQRDIDVLRQPFRDHSEYVNRELPD